MRLYDMIKGLARLLYTQALRHEIKEIYIIKDDNVGWMRRTNISLCMNIKYTEGLDKILGVNEYKKS